MRFVKRTFEFAATCGEAANRDFEYMFGHRPLLLGMRNMMKSAEHVDDTIARKQLRIPCMFLPSSSIDSLYSVVNTINTKLVASEADHLSILQMCCIRNSIVSGSEALVQDPEVSK